MKYIALCLLFVLSPLYSSFANNNGDCTPWKKRSGATCTVLGDSANIYERSCEQACWYNARTRQGNMGPACDREWVCHTSDPTPFNGGCGPWVKRRVSSSTCYSPRDGDWQAKWVRACTVGLAQKTCSKENPNN